MDFEAIAWRYITDLIAKENQELPTHNITVLTQLSQDKTALLEAIKSGPSQVEQVFWGFIKRSSGTLNELVEGNPDYQRFVALCIQLQDWVHILGGQPAVQVSVSVPAPAVNNPVVPVRAPRATRPVPAVSVQAIPAPTSPNSAGLSESQIHILTAMLGGGDRVAQMKKLWPAEYEPNKPTVYSRLLWRMRHVAEQALPRIREIYTSQTRIEDLRDNEQKFFMMLCAKYISFTAAEQTLRGKKVGHQKATRRTSVAQVRAPAPAPTLPAQPPGSVEPPSNPISYRPISPQQCRVLEVSLLGQPATLSNAVIAKRTGFTMGATEAIKKGALRFLQVALDDPQNLEAENKRIVEQITSRYPNLNVEEITAQIPQV